MDFNSHMIREKRQHKANFKMAWPLCRGIYPYLIFVTALVRVFVNRSTNMEKLSLVHFQQLRIFSSCSWVSFVKLRASMHQQLPSQKEILIRRRNISGLCGYHFQPQPDQPGHQYEKDSSTVSEAVVSCGTNVGAGSQKSYQMSHTNIKLEKRNGYYSISKPHH